MAKTIKMKCNAPYMYSHKAKSEDGPRNFLRCIGGYLPSTCM